MVGEISWKAAAADASCFTSDDAGRSKKWMKPSHDRTISLHRHSEGRGKPPTTTSKSAENAHTFDYNAADDAR